MFCGTKTTVVAGGKAKYYVVKVMVKSDGLHWFNHKLHSRTISFNDGYLVDLPEFGHIVGIKANVHYSIAFNFGATNFNPSCPLKKIEYKKIIIVILEVI